MRRDPDVHRVHPFKPLIFPGVPYFFDGQPVWGYSSGLIYGEDSSYHPIATVENNRNNSCVQNGPRNVKATHKSRQWDERNVIFRNECVILNDNCESHILKQ